MPKCVTDLDLTATPTLICLPKLVGREGVDRFCIFAGLGEVVLSAMSVEKTTTTLLKHQVLSLVQLVVYVVFEEAIAMGQATSATLLLITELSEALMWRLGGTAASSAEAGQ